MFNLKEQNDTSLNTIKYEIKTKHIKRFVLVLNVKL